jgi:hypothetical protein
MFANIKPMTKRFTYVTAAALVALFVVAHLRDVNLLAQSEQASSMCRARQQVAQGTSPSGTPWVIAVSLRNNGPGCSAWLLGFEFRPDRSSEVSRLEMELSKGHVAPGGFKWGWGVPAGGHLPNDFVISGQDEYEGSERVFAGAAGGSVRSITLTLSTRRRVVLHPKLPHRTLRQRFVWLRNLRYFVWYYPRGSHVQKVTARKSGGVVVLRGREGAFEQTNIRGFQ